MTTPPRVTRAEVEAAIARVHWRHAKVDHPRRSGLSDDPAGVLEHLTRHSASLPQWVIGEDTLDGLTLQSWLWWEDRRRERALLRRGLRAGLYLREMGTPLGITTHQGVRDRLDRLDALLARDQPDEKLTRAARRAAALDESISGWLDAHSGRVRAVIARLLYETDRVPELAVTAGPSEPDSAGGWSSSDGGGEHEVLQEAAEWLGELRVDLDSNAVSPATVSLLGLAVGPLRIGLQRLDLDPGHGLWRVVREVDRLRSDAATGRLGSLPAVAR